MYTNNLVTTPHTPIKNTYEINTTYKEQLFKGTRLSLQNKNVNKSKTTLHDNSTKITSSHQSEVESRNSGKISKNRNRIDIKNSKYSSNIKINMSTNSINNINTKRIRQGPLKEKKNIQQQFKSSVIPK